jgi:hypothetical protein
MCYTCASAEGRHRNSITSGEGMALHYCWAPCPRDPGVPPGEKPPFGGFGARQRRAVLDSTPSLVPAMSRTCRTCSACAAEGRGARGSEVGDIR